MEGLATMFPLPTDSTLMRPHHMAGQAVAAWEGFHRNCTKIKTPSSDGTLTQDLDIDRLPLGARTRIYITGRMRFESTIGIKLSKDLEIVMDAASQIIGIRPARLVMQMSLMERALFWAQKPYRIKRGHEGEHWQRYRERWERKRHAYRDIVERTEWQDEETDSDLQSWHASDTESEGTV
jgi:hypothetical protein